MLTNREIKLLEILIKNNGMKADDLAIKLDVSSRTILRDISNIINFLKKYNINIKSIKGRYSLIIYEKENFDEMLNELKLLKFENIYKNIFIKILEDENLTIIDLANIFYESESNINIKINKLKDILLKYDLFIKSKNKNFYIEGSEENIRKFLIDNYIIIQNNIFNFTLLKGFDVKKIEKIKEIMKKHLIKENIYLSDLDFSNFLSLIIISIYRKNKILNINIIYRNLLVENIVRDINQYFNLNLGKSEIYYIIKNSIFYEINDIKKVKKSIENILKNSLDRIKQSSLNNYDFNDKFMKSIFKHIEILIKRNLIKNELINPLLKDIKKKYFLEFNDAMIIKEEIYKELNFKISEDEIGYLAIHLGAAKFDFSGRKRVIVICNYGMGISQIVKMKIENRYKNLNLIGVYPVTYLKLALLQEPDYIVSTVKIDIEDNNIPIIDASKILYDDEPLDFNIYEEFQIKEILYKKLFFDIDVKNKEDFFDKAIKLINKNYDICIEKLNIVKNHDLKFSTEIGNLVAIPHAVVEGDFNSFIAIFRLKEQIIWNDEKVKFVFFIMINSEQKYYIKCLKRLYQYILLPNNLSNMLNAKNFYEFIEGI